MEYLERIQSLQVREPLSFSEIRFALPCFQLAVLLGVYSSLKQFARRGASRDTDCQVATFIARSLKIDSIVTDDFTSRLLNYEHVLLQDPGCKYGQCTVETKNLYRAAVSAIADECKCPAEKVARTAVSMSWRIASENDSVKTPKSHVGYYLLDSGRKDLVQGLSGTTPKYSGLKKILPGSRIKTFVGVICLGTPLFAYFCVRLFCAGPIDPIVVSVVSFCYLAICGDTLARILHVFFALAVAERIPPMLDYSRGIPRSHKVLISMPCLLLDNAVVDQLLRTLEEHYMIVHEPNAYFVLLTDFADSGVGPASAAERDLLGRCARGVKALNSKYANSGRSSPFLLLHRQRRYSAAQGYWLGWERKRGKLMQLNRLLIHGINEFDDFEGAIDDLKHVRFVVVADDDTQLTGGSIQRLVGLLAHPLNRPVIAKDGRSIERGFGIFQPNLCISKNSASRWRLAKSLLGPDCDRERPPENVNNAYFDLFGECAYSGKGIYDVRAFQQILDDFLPSDRILSHDTVEGGRVKTGFAGKVTFVEPCPNSMKEFYQRLHRWVRGDWQNLLLLAGVHESRLGKVEKVRVSDLSQYLLGRLAIRSLVVIAKATLLIMIALGGSNVSVTRTCQYWLVVMAPAYLEFFGRIAILLVLGQFFYRRRFVGLVLRKIHMTEILFSVTGLQQAMTVADAIFRSTYRSFSGRGMLSWHSARYSELMSSRFSFVDIYAICSCILPMILLVSLLLSKTASSVGTAILLLYNYNIILYYCNQSSRFD